MHLRTLVWLASLCALTGCPSDPLQDDDTTAADDDTGDDDTAADDDTGDADSAGDDDSADPPGWACGDPLVDDRDGREYSTLLMGTQCWMGKNIDVGQYVPSTESDDRHSDLLDPHVIEKYCYRNDEAYCEERGGLYDWPEMMQGSYAEGAQGICMHGWHVPSDAEFHTMVHFVDETAEAEHESEGPTEVYIGTDWGARLKEGGDTGFDWLIAGRRYWNGVFWGAEIGFLWTSSHWDPENAFLYEVFPDRDDGTHPYHDMLRGHSVRCIRD